MHFYEVCVEIYVKSSMYFDLFESCFDLSVVRPALTGIWVAILPIFYSPFYPKTSF